MGGHLMIAVDLNAAFEAAQVVNAVLITVWFGLAVLAWRKMRRYDLSSGVALGLTMMIVFVPVFGALAFLTGKPVFGESIIE